MAESRDNALPESRERVHFVPLDQIRPCPLQPRKDFPGESLQELAESIKAQGIIQPLIVRPRQGHYELIAGERRWRAAKLAGTTEIPVILRDVDDRSVLELALIENLQRENLNPIEEAQGYAELLEQFNLRQEDIAQRVGKSRAAVANALRLLKLPGQVQASIRTGVLSLGHAKVLLGLDLPERQNEAADRILKHQLSVRQTEELVSHLRQHEAALSTTSSTGLPGAKSPATQRSAHIVDLETRLRERFGTKVQLRYRQGKGSLEIRFFTDADLERILEIVGLPAE